VEVEAFFKLLEASEEPLHEHTEVTLLDFITRPVAIKSKYFFSNNCYNDLLKLISDIIPKPHKVPKDMYQSKKMMTDLGLKYEKIDVRPDNCMHFWKEHANEKKCLECGQSRFIEVVTEDGEKVTTEVAQKQLRYFPITPRLKRLFISKRTARLRMTRQTSFSTISSIAPEEARPTAILGTTPDEEAQLATILDTNKC
jgi:hypothetical protein